jgi:hypothetical protein
MEVEDVSLIRQRVLAVESLMKLFRYERFVYLFACICSFAALIYCGYRLFSAGTLTQQHDVVLGLFGSSGLVGVATGAFIRVWSRAMELVLLGAVEK